MNKAEVELCKRKVSIDVISVESDYYYVTPAQPIDQPKERGCDEVEQSD